MWHIQNAPHSSTIKKPQVDIINITPTGSCQKRTIRKKHPILIVKTRTCGQYWLVKSCPEYCETVTEIQAHFFGKLTSD